MNSQIEINRPSRRRLKINAIQELTGYSRQTIWRWIRDGNFPQPEYLGSTRTWWEDEVIDWMESRAAAMASERPNRSNLPQCRQA